jgi:hypothetical protein
MKILLSLSFLALLLISCADPNQVAFSALENEEYSNIQLTGFGWFSCSNDDVFRTRFTATNSKGRKVTGTVCSGILKGATIRYDFR